MKRYQDKSKANKRIALERIRILFRQAKAAFKKDKSLANRYVKLARELSMKYKVPIPSNLKKQFCKHCRSYIMPSVNARVRTREGKLVYYCLECKKYMRYPYLKEQKERRKIKSKR
jgi:ribonuclease P protein subunit RPR2